MTETEVTVCIPTYEGAAHLAPCLASVAEQDLTGVEVLVIDDGSTDDTIGIVEAHRPALGDLRVERNPERLGPVANLNRCFERARSPWVKPVFQDDLIEPGCVTAMMEARRTGVSVVICGRTYRYHDGIEPWRRRDCESVMAHALGETVAMPFVPAEVACDVILDLVAADRPHVNVVGEPVAVLLERRAVLDAGGFDERLVQLWDYELVLRLAVRAGLVSLPERLATFRVHGAGATSVNFEADRFRTAVLDPLQLLVSYATEPAYRQLRRRARDHRPPIDLVAKAMTAATAARRAATDLPEGAGREAVEARLQTAEAGLPWRRRRIRHLGGRVLRHIALRGGRVPGVR